MNWIGRVEEEMEGDVSPAVAIEPALGVSCPVGDFHNWLIFTAIDNDSPWPFSWWGWSALASWAQLACVRLVDSQESNEAHIVYLRWSLCRNNVFLLWSRHLPRGGCTRGFE